VLNDGKMGITQLIENRLKSSALDSNSFQSAIIDVYLYSAKLTPDKGENNPESPLQN